jgi:hypothetical protein
MKKMLLAVLAVIIVVVLSVLLFRVMQKSGKAYGLAEDLKKAGLPADEIRQKENNSMYSEVLVLGDGLNVKVTAYGNGLFMDNIIKNLEAEKNIKTEPGVYKPAILVSRLYILVVYSEPAPGMVKRMLAEKFGQVREY